MTAKVTEILPVPDNPVVNALIETILVFIIILIAGFLINTINTVITTSLAVIIGTVPAFIIRNYLTYPGTVHHELSHALLALLTGAKVKKIVLFPKGNALGSVELETRGNIFFRSLQLSLSAIAPVFLGAVSLFLMWRFLLPDLHKLWQYILFWYFFISILFHMSMSGADYLNFFKGMLPTGLLIFLLFLILRVFGIVF